MSFQISMTPHQSQFFTQNYFIANERKNVVIIVVVVIVIDVAF